MLFQYVLSFRKLGPVGVFWCDFWGYVIGEKDSNAKDAFIVLLFLFSQVL